MHAPALPVQGSLSGSEEMWGRGGVPRGDTTWYTRR